MNQTIALISGNMITSNVLKSQLLEYSSLFSEVVLYGIDDHLPSRISADLVIYSSDIAHGEVQVLSCDVQAVHEIIASRTINFETADALFKIRKGEKAYIVNDSNETTHQFIQHLRHIGLEDIVMVPYEPGMKVDPAIRYAVTPGDANMLTEPIETVVDIGPRLFSLATIHAIIRHLGMLDALKETYSENYLSKVINIVKRSARFASEVSVLNEQLNTILTSIDEGIMVFDRKNRINIMNRPLMDYLNIPFRNYTGEGINRVIRDRDIVNFCVGIQVEKEALFKVNHTNLVFIRQKISSGDTLVFVKNLEEQLLESNRLNQELVQKGHIAKYTFDHILGHSPAIQEARHIARKLAASELTMLIEGETGTGKELFASAIHNASSRAANAYLAINFSAFTDELIESELFGYESGAFTGAKKGGKVGLFEQANGGTLMLDEIGDISPKMQTRLLRVLQEGEIIRIGGTVIRSVDVRIIAATNKDLRKMVDEGSFREDLYYRLKMGRVSLPPLRQRKEDIPLLIEHFLLGDYDISHEAADFLTQYSWKGNVRELKGTIEYMKAIAEGRQLTKMEVPGEIRVKPLTRAYLNEEERCILEAVYECNRSETACGRQRLVQMTYDRIGLSENQIRGRLLKLVQKGLLTSRAGRKGSHITDAGINELNHH